MASTLTINGSVIDQTSNTLRLWTVTQLAINLRGYSTLDFSQVAIQGTAAWTADTPVIWEVDGTVRFTGTILSHQMTQDELGRSYAYHCADLRYSANHLAITSATGTGTITFNLPTTDRAYDPSMDGMSLGDMLDYILTQHASELTALGITTDASTASDLAALTIVPPDPVRVQGRLWNAIEDLLTAHANQYIAFVRPADGVIRFLDTTVFTPTTLTLDDDPITLSAVKRDSQDNYSRVLIRGEADIEVAYLSLADGTLEEAFDSTDKANWSMADFNRPGDGSDAGDITGLTSTTLTVESDSASRTWTTNHWSSIDAYVVAINPAATTLAFSETRKITACTSMSAGGSATLTLDRPLDNSGYTRYQITGTPPDSGSNTWRLYNIVPTWVAQHLATQFQHSFRWDTATLTQQLLFPVSSIVNDDGTSVPALFEILTATGQIRFRQPVVRAFGTLSKLETGGAATDGIPADIRVAVPFSRGTLTAVYPPNDTGGAPQYAGTLYTVDGVPRTWPKDIPEWRDAGAQAQMEELAQQYHRTVCDTIVEFSVTYSGKYEAGLDMGQAINIDQVDGVPTGLEAVNCPATSVTLENRGKLGWVTTLTCSNRWRPYTGDRLFVPPDFGREAFLGGGFGFGGFSAFPGFGTGFSGFGGLDEVQIGPTVGPALGGPSVGSLDRLPGLTGWQEPQSPFGLADALAAGMPTGAGVRDNSARPNPVRSEEAQARFAQSNTSPTEARHQRVQRQRQEKARQAEARKARAKQLREERAKRNAERARRLRELPDNRMGPELDDFTGLEQG